MEKKLKAVQRLELKLKRVMEREAGVFRTESLDAIGELRSLACDNADFTCKFFMKRKSRQSIVSGRQQPTVFKTAVCRSL